MASQQHDSRTISLQIPAGANPGDTLTFKVDGVELQLVVPDGATEGEVLEIQVGSGESTDQQEQEVTRIPLDGDDKVFVLHHQVPAEARQQDDDKKKSGSDDGTHAMPWPAGRELVKCLSLLPSELCESIETSESILELGSGLGLVGLAIASCSKHHKPTTVVLSDCESAMPLLQSNVECNHHLIPTHVKVETRELQWETSVSTTSEAQKYDLIVGSDLLYNAEMIPALVSTLRRHTNKHVLLAVRWRKPTLERSFFEETSKVVDWKLVSSLPDLPCDVSWESYGNSETFSAYMQTTMVGVQGKLKPLVEVTEEDASQMTQHEYDAWERLQIQIYWGTLVETTEERESKRARVGM